MVNVVLWVQWVDVNRWYSARGTVEPIWDNIFLSYSSEGCPAFLTVHNKCWSQCTVHPKYKQGWCHQPTGLAFIQKCLQYKKAFSIHMCPVGITPHPTSVCVTFSLSSGPHERIRPPYVFYYHLYEGRRWGCLLWEHCSWANTYGKPLWGKTIRHLCILLKHLHISEKHLQMNILLENNQTLVHSLTLRSHLQAVWWKSFISMETFWWPAADFSHPSSIGSPHIIKYKTLLIDSLRKLS